MEVFCLKKYSTIMLIKLWNPLLKKSTSKTIHFCHSKGQKRHGHIFVTMLWRNHLRHLCSVIAVVPWRFCVFCHRYRYIHDDFPPSLNCFSRLAAYTCMVTRLTRVRLVDWHVLGSLIETCWARRLTRVGLVGVLWALTWQHVGAEVAARDIMTFFSS